MVNWSSIRVSRIRNEEKTVSSRNGVGEIGSPHIKEWNWIHIIYHTPKSTQNRLKTETKNWNNTTPRRNMGQNLLEAGVGNDFLVMTPKAQTTKVKIDHGITLALWYLLESGSVVPPVLFLFQSIFGYLGSSVVPYEF